MKNKLVYILYILLIVIGLLLLSTAIYIKYKFPDQNIDEMIYYLFNGIEGASKDVFISGILTSMIPFLIVLSILLLPLFIKPIKRRNIIEVSFRNREKQIILLPMKKVIYSALIFLGSIVISFSMLEVPDYLKRLNNFSTIIEDYYVDGRNVEITFPEEKRNLIVLYVESLENTLIEAKSGGGWDYTVIPELKTIAEENVNFSNSELIGGAQPVAGTGWTAAGLVATSSGLPLKIPVQGNNYTSSENFLAGAYTLGDILKEHGYNLTTMFGSEAEFGGRSSYYAKHGNYQILDVNTAISQGRMTENERVWWGFDDTHLFDWAKEEITRLSGLGQPFSFSFLTANTHFPDGYLEEGIEEKYPTQYENVHAFTSQQVEDFVDWFQKQDFYENTTLVILGDHHSMQDSQFYLKNMVEGSQRTIYNAIVNPAEKPTHSQNRTFTALDMFPTMLASIGVEFQGDRLGLGTNLFSDKKTLAEELGQEYLNEELEKNSNYYNKYILQSDYLDLINQSKQEEQ